jgi:hypothetical protein
MTLAARHYGSASELAFMGNCLSRQAARPPGTVNKDFAVEKNLLSLSLVLGNSARDD